MCTSHALKNLLALVPSLVMVAIVQAGSVPIFHEQAILTAGGVIDISGSFGDSVAVSGDVLVAGMRQGDFGFAFPDEHGLAMVFRRTASGWIQEAQLAASDASEDDHFGTDVAIFGDLIVVGAPDDDDQASNSGSAYVFRHDGSAWVQEQKLLATTGSQNNRFGLTVAVSGDLLAVGAVGDAYLFHYNGVAWLEELHVPAPTPPSHGAPVSVSGNAALVGAPSANQALVYRFNGTNWAFEQALTVASGFGDRFGAAVAIMGDRALVGDPWRDAPGLNAGAAYVFEFDGAEWNLDQMLTPSDPAANTYFGGGVSLFNDRLAVASHYDPDPAFPSGAGTDAVYLFGLDGGQWVQQQKITECHPVVPGALGHDLALAEDTVVASRWDSIAYSAVFVYTPELADCDGNGISDACDIESQAPDCNWNAVLDECELATGTSADCNVNGQPDECEAAIPYKLVEPGAYPGFIAGFNGDQYILWLNQFNVIKGGQTITHVGFRWAVGPEGAPATVLIYDDPNNDGNPNDAVLLAAIDTKLTRSTGNNYSKMVPPPTLVPVPPTHVGEPGESFFIGAIVNSYQGQTMYPAALSSQTLMRSWAVIGPAGTATINTLATNPTALTLINGRFHIFGIAHDCNGNEVWDQCDIDDDPTADSNSNGILDKCERPCSADINGDRVVNVDDLLGVINAWGMCIEPCPDKCPPDIAPAGGDCAVNVDDLLMVINAWGPCDSP